MTGDKSSLRREFLGRIRAMTAEEKARESAAVRDLIRAWEPFVRARTVLLFCPLPSEPDLLPLMEHSGIRGRNLLFPVTRSDHSLTLHVVRNPDGLRGISGFLREPDPGIHPQVDPQEIDAALIPGIAFTRSGVRLGRGRGCYDRLLAGLPPSVPLAGICFRCQIADDLPRDPHDITVPLLPGL